MLFPFLQHLTQLSFGETVSCEVDRAAAHPDSSPTAARQPLADPTPTGDHALAKMKDGDGPGRGGAESAASLRAPGVGRPDSGSRARREGLRSPSWESIHLPRRGSRSHSGTPTPRLELLGGNFAHGEGARPPLRERGSGARRRRRRGARSGESCGSRVSAGRGRGRGGGALTTGRTRE